MAGVKWIWCFGGIIRFCPCQLIGAFLHQVGAALLVLSFFNKEAFKVRKNCIFSCKLSKISKDSKNRTKCISQLSVSVPMQGVDPIIACRQREARLGSECEHTGLILIATWGGPCRCDLTADFSSSGNKIWVLWQLVSLLTLLTKHKVGRRVCYCNCRSSPFSLPDRYFYIRFVSHFDLT